MKDFKNVVTVMPASLQNFILGHFFREQKGETISTVNTILIFLCKHADVDSLCSILVANQNVVFIASWGQRLLFGL